MHPQLAASCCLQLMHVHAPLSTTTQPKALAPAGLLLWLIALAFPFFGVINDVLGAFTSTFEVGGSVDDDTRAGSPGPPLLPRPRGRRKRVGDGLPPSKSGSARVPCYLTAAPCWIPPFFRPSSYRRSSTTSTTS